MRSGKKKAGGKASPSAPERMEASALRILARRAHTRAELRRKLRLRGHPVGEVDVLLDRLTEIGYLDDEAAARGWARHRLEVRPMGRRRLAAELAEKGIARESLEAVLEEAYPEGVERELALRAARKRGLGAGPGSRERMVRFLRGRGFPFGCCLEAAGALEAAAGEEHAAGAELPAGAEFPAGGDESS
ncbi:MAG: regulatory protein RecX [bacterium]